MSLAADTRAAVRERPFLLFALRAGLVNHSAAAAWLAEDAGLDGDPEAIATALRRFREELSPLETRTRRATVTMHGGVGLADSTAMDAANSASESSSSSGSESDTDSEASGDSAIEPVFQIGEQALVPDGPYTAVLATGAVDTAALATVLRRLLVRGVDPAAAGVAGDALLVVVDRREGATAVRVVEAALDAVPIATPES